MKKIDIHQDLDQFLKMMKKYVEDKGGGGLTHSEEGISFLIKKHQIDFFSFKYTKEMDKDFKALWERKNSKLAKALK